MRGRIAFIILIIATVFSLHGQSYSPYILAFESNETLEKTVADVKNSLKNSGFIILGNYMPMDAKDRSVIIATHEKVLDAVNKTGGLSAFFSALRIAITKEEQTVVVSYMNPSYWGNAYFQEDFNLVSKDISEVKDLLRQVFESLGSFVGTEFGSKKGITPDKLRKYRYMVGMPRFEDTHLLGSFATFNKAKNYIEKQLTVGNKEMSKVYEIEIEDQDLKLYGVALLGEKGENHFLPKIDISSPKHTAFLPYEFLVYKNEVHMLHGRYRIALSFPDLTMGTFTKIMSTPKDIKKMIERVVISDNQ